MEILWKPRFILHQSLELISLASCSNLYENVKILQIFKMPESKPLKERQKADKKFNFLTDFFFIFA